MGKASAGAVSLSQPGKRWTANRRLGRLEADLVRPHSRHVGEVLHAYNSAHAALFMIFMRLAAAGDYALAIDLWHTARTDRSQRDMAGAVARHSPLLNRTYRKAILWAIGSIAELASFRNDAAHTDMMWYYDRLVPGLSARPQVRARLEKLPFEKNWRKLKGDLLALSTYLGLIDLSLGARSAWPLAKRPRLQLSRSSSAPLQAKRRQAKKAARQRQRRSSRDPAADHGEDR